MSGMKPTGQFSETAQKFDLVTADEFCLAAQKFHPPPGCEARAAVVISCATGVHAGFYKRFASWLSIQGVGVVTYDYRYTGLSYPPPYEPSSFDDETRRKANLDCPAEVKMSSHWAQQDTAAAVNCATETWPGVPLTVIGHSLGAHLITLYPDVHPKITRFLNVAGGQGYYGSYTHADRVKEAFEEYIIPDLEKDRLFYGSRIGLGYDIPYGPGKEWVQWLFDPRWALSSEGAETWVKDFTHPFLFVGFEDDQFCEKAIMLKLFPEFNLSNEQKFSLWIDPSAQSPAWPSCGHVHSFVDPPSGGGPKRADTVWKVYLDWIVDGKVDQSVGEFGIWTEADKAALSVSDGKAQNASKL